MHVQKNTSSISVWGVSTIVLACKFVWKRVKQKLDWQHLVHLTIGLGWARVTFCMLRFIETIAVLKLCEGAPFAAQTYDLCLQASWVCCQDKGKAFKWPG